MNKSVIAEIYTDDLGSLMSEKLHGKVYYQVPVQALHMELTEYGAGIRRGKVSD